MGQKHWPDKASSMLPVACLCCTYNMLTCDTILTNYVLALHICNANCILITM